ncbi:MBL fold metallo-hydrolase [Salinimonas chungwhensis]|uniref:MBL fold metallo-hydrolase n=1 Tax=Salinimonas chungwhensis TaxID=265425 RepID=UPI0003817F09|nr:MBL fold metallo-hydrolase [Salinimonas chungwhensis]
MQIHTLHGYIQHIFLVEEADQLLLLDGCSRADVKLVSQYITQSLQRPLSDLTLIMVTHMHPDHAGGAHKLRSLSGARIAAHPKAPRWYTGIKGRAAHIIDVALMNWVAGRLGKRKRMTWYSPILKPDIMVKDEQQLPGFENWQVHYTPGHTNHDLSLLHTPSGNMYVADLLVKVKGQLCPPYPICHPNQYKRSLQRVARLQPNTLFCAHVKPLTGEHVPFDDIIAHAPTQPKNHWHSTKNRIVKKLGINKSKTDQRGKR